MSVEDDDYEREERLLDIKLDRERREHLLEVRESHAEADKELLVKFACAALPSVYVDSHGWVNRNGLPKKLALAAFELADEMLAELKKRSEK